MQEIENRGNYFGAFACTVVLIGKSLERVRDAVSQVVKVFGRWDASLIGERLNLFHSVSLDKFRGMDQIGETGCC